MRRSTGSVVSCVVALVAGCAPGGDGAVRLAAARTPGAIAQAARVLLVRGGAAGRARVLAFDRAHPELCIDARHGLLAFYDGVREAVCLQQLDGSVLPRTGRPGLDAALAASLFGLRPSGWIPVPVSAERFAALDCRPEGDGLTITVGTIDDAPASVLRVELVEGRPASCSLIESEPAVPR